MTSDNIAEYVGENNQFTEKPVTEYPPVIQDNTVTTKVDWPLYFHTLFIT